MDESGLWLAVATTTGVQLYMACDAGGVGDTSSSPVVFTAQQKNEMKECDGGAAPRQWKLITVVGGGADGSPSPAGSDAVLGVAWAPSVYYTAGVVTCSESGRVSLWRSVDAMGRFEEVYRAQLPAAAWRVTWAAQEYGRIFAVSAADGSITTFTGVDAVWVQQRLPPPTLPAEPQQFCERGCTGIGFAPFLPSNALLNIPFNVSMPADLSPLQLVSCYRSPRILIWWRQLSRVAGLAGGGSGQAGSTVPNSNGVEGAHTGEDRHHHSAESPTSSWSVATELPLVLQDSPAGPSSPGFPTPPCWREVAWAKNAGLPFHYVAAGSEEGYVGVWIHNDQEWRLVLADASSRGVAVTRLSWSEVGTFLLVSYADGQVVMWKETATGGWKVVTELEGVETDV